MDAKGDMDIIRDEVGRRIKKVLLRFAGEVNNEQTREEITDAVADEWEKFIDEGKRN